MEKAPGGKRPFRGCRWEDNIILVLKETGCKDVECIHLAQDRVQ